MSLALLSDWYAQHGSLAVIEGNVDGWIGIDRAIQYRLWNVRLSTALVENAARYLAHLIAFEEWQQADYLADRMIQSLDDLSFQSWEPSTFGVFLMKLWSIHTGRYIHLDRPKVAGLGVYQRIFDAWTDDDTLRAAIGDMCDYHLEQSFDRQGYPQFTEPPYELFPVDVLALEVIRKRMGLSTPRPDHPLLATPLASPPPPDVRPRMGLDPLLERVIAKARAAGFLPAEGI